MKVKDLMNQNIFTVNISTPLKDFAEIDWLEIEIVLS